MILLLLCLKFVAVANWQRHKPFALILLIATSKPDLHLLLSSRPGVGLLQALSWLSSVPATYISYIISPTSSVSLPMLCLLISLLFTAIDQSVYRLHRSCRARVRIPVRGNRFFVLYNVLTGSGSQLAFYWMSPGVSSWRHSRNWPLIST